MSYETQSTAAALEEFWSRPVACACGAQVYPVCAPDHAVSRIDDVIVIGCPQVRGDRTFTRMSNIGRSRVHGIVECVIALDRVEQVPS